MYRLLWWIRRDLRLADNTALYAALRDAAEIVPVFILDDALIKSPRLQGARIAWMLDALATFDGDLRQWEARLIIRRGKPATELVKLCREAEAQGVFFNRDYSPYATRRDAAVTAALHEAGFVVESFKDLIIHETHEINNGQGKPYSVYTPYRKAWSTLPKPAVITLPELAGRIVAPENLTSLPIPSSAEFGSQAATEPIAVPGEAAAQHQLEAFLSHAVYEYREGRNRLAEPGTSRLSPYLRWGMLSPRTAYWQAREALERATDADSPESVNTWISELVWREFNYQNLALNPASVRQSFKPAFDRIQWENSVEWFAAWCEGRTGYPVVDAAMRQLNTTGWMHNRARMIVASFLCKDLLIDWRWGERYFMQRLLDGDAANNVGGWQWTAGTGTDAAPYFRIFNPTSQGAKFDPQGDYVRRWLPMLRDVPAKFIHEPSKLPPMDQRMAGCVIGEDYPLPLVDHSVQRGRALTLYGIVKR